jgi:tellurite resistance protein
MARQPLPNLAPTVPSGRFSRVPPAIFVPIFGFLGLGPAWRRGAEAFALPQGIGEALLGAGAALCLFALAACLAKAVRRPGAVADDLGALPGRAGLTAASLSLFLPAAASAPYLPGLARTVSFLGLGAYALGFPGLARAILWATIPVAAAIWAASALSAARKGVAAPLRPLLAIHLAPAALFATVLALVGADALALRTDASTA